MSGTLDLPFIALIGCLVGILGPELVGPARRHECPWGFHWLNPHQKDQCVRMAYRPRQQPDTVRKDFGWFLPDKIVTKRTTTPRYPGGDMPWYDSPEAMVYQPPYQGIPVAENDPDPDPVGDSSEEATEEPGEGGTTTNGTTTTPPPTTAISPTPPPEKTTTKGGGGGGEPPNAVETPGEGPPDGVETTGEPPDGGGGERRTGGKQKTKRKADQVQGHPVVEDDWHPWSWSKPKRTKKAPSKSKVVPTRKPLKSDAVDRKQKNPKPQKVKVVPSQKITAKKGLPGSSPKPTTIRPPPAKVTPKSKTLHIVEEFPLWSWNS